MYSFMDAWHFWHNSACLSENFTVKWLAILHATHDQHYAISVYHVFVVLV